jgi:hypothetical protein
MFLDNFSFANAFFGCFAGLQLFLGGFFSLYCIQHCFICRPSDSTVSEDARSNPGLLRSRHWQSDALTTRPDLIHMDD